MLQQKQALQRQAAKSWQDALSILVNHNPTAVYKYIQAAYPNQFQKMVPGFEKNATSVDQMIGFLSQKAVEKGKPLIYVATLSMQIPRDPKQTNFTKH